MRTRRRTNLVLGIALLAAAVVVMLNALNLLPASVFDLLVRAWPALLVLAGLSLLLRTRIPLGSLLALIVTLALAGGVAALAYSSRSAQQRSDYRESVVQNIDANITLLRVQIRTLTTDVELLRRIGSDRVITGEFVGSAESRVAVTYDETDTAANLTLSETQINPFPMLENVGRGTLRLELPPDLPLDIELQGADGSVILNMSGLAVERMNLDLQHGDALVTLPVYAPLLSGRDDMLGTLAVRDGDITLFIDPQVAARLELNLGGSGISPVYEPDTYNFLVGDILEARNIDNADIEVHYTVTVPRGRLTVREPL
ncbi:MAG TPA: hypothetical protein VKY59_12240 [Spirillospora sp.]|nr:hypothetical protein [Spirillospora sp.]